MAMADYRLCDICGEKAFYDSNLNYEIGERQQDKTWKYPETPFRIAGENVKYGHSLDYLGDWAVICNVCSKKYKTAIVRIEETASKEGRSNG